MQDISSQCKNFHMFRSIFGIMSCRLTTLLIPLPLKVGVKFPSCLSLRGLVTASMSRLCQKWDCMTSEMESEILKAFPCSSGMLTPWMLSSETVSHETEHSLLWWEPKLYKDARAPAHAENFLSLTSAPSHLRYQAFEWRSLQLIQTITIYFTRLRLQTLWSTVTSRDHEYKNW